MNGQTLKRLGLGALFACLAAAGCADATADKKPPKEESDEEIDTEKHNERFRENVEKLTQEEKLKTGKKEDFLGLKGPCDVLGPIAEASEDKFDAKMGVYMEMSGSFNVGPKKVLGGADLVLDLYHHQLTVSTFKGDGLTTSVGGSGEISLEAGFAHGFDQSANDWLGYFATGEFDFSLPVLKNFAEGNVGTFVGASDLDDSGNIDSMEEVGEPGENVFGGYVGVTVSAGFEPVFGSSPVTASAERAFWKQHKGATEELHQVLSGKLFKFFRLDPRLVTPEGEPCPSDWRGEGSDQGCVIEFGEDGESHTKRGLKTAAALCIATGGCQAVPLTAPATVHALSIGAVRDAGSSVDKYCEDDGWF